MPDFMLLYSVIVGISLVCIAFSRLTAYCIIPLTIITCIASMPFGDDLSFRLPLLVMLALTAALSTNSWIVGGVITVHSVWMLAFRDITTVFHDAPGVTGSGTQITLISVAMLLYGLLETTNATTRMLQSARLENNSLKRSVEALTEANIGYSTFATVARQQASLEERNRITHEIHDNIGSVLTNIRMLSESALSRIDRSISNITTPLEAIRQQARTGLYDTRRALRLLRAAEYERPRGLEAIGELLRIYESATRVQTHMYIGANRHRIEESSVFPTVYHFIQESLTNAFRHGRANEAVVRMIEDGDWLIVSVRDNGVGADHIVEGIGIQGIREQLTSTGGSLHYTKGPGFTVTAKIPLKEDE